MNKLRIASFNVKDNKVNMNGGMREDGTFNALIVSNIIKQFDLVGTQEFTIKYLSNVMNSLENYKVYGNYRYGNLLTKMPFNETNSIITNQDVVSSNTIKLPFIADNFNDFKTSIVKMSIMPRIATIVIFKTIDGEEMCMINTHLDYQVPSIQIRQLNVIKNLILKYKEKYPIILTGDFNMELSDNQFNSFISDINDTVKHVDINGYSWGLKDGIKKNLDHIFVPNNYSIEDAGIISSENTSDHSLIYANIRRK